MNYCNFTIYDMIARNAVLYPGKCALVYGNTRVSFSEYKELCDRCAAGLIRKGIAVGDRVAVLSSNCESFMVLCGAVAKIGAVVVAINSRLSVEELEYVLQDTKPKYLFSSKEFVAQASKAALAAGSVRQLFVFKMEPVESGALPFDSFFAEDPGLQASIISTDSPYIIIHTAAVGGHPRGCVLSQANVLNAGWQMSQMFNLSDKDCHVCILPLFHIGGFSMAIGVMQQGGKNVAMDHFDPVEVLQLIEKERGTFFGSFPPMLGVILDAYDKKLVDTSSLRGVGGMDSTETIERFLKRNPQATFYSIYGQTEAMPVSCCDFLEKPGSIGRPGIATRIAILDDLDREVAIGEQGEICVHSPSVFQGYWNLEEDTSYTFRNGWHHTGDLGRIDQGGFLWYAGRKSEKELIKSGGENVYPAEVEKTILSHDAIQEVSVIGVPDPEWGEAVVAVCVLKKGEHVSPQELVDFVAARIARYKKPKRVIFVDSLPKDSKGTIDRERVKEAYGGKKRRN